ncbi:hypothetical protein FOQG_08619 [Fusarium oxysporum f. sp. raphani 54005]|uniref:Uncharacterized protein n=7 Tax=Fusarium oxysporum TaxID=5507 RepID=X0CBV3_FUSOX|nr:hypothetical protein FOXG_17896 [Fusarium oxysporum f. sp. lycopersici 4287]EWZ50952.1 hypothetical protein FOZG_01249 [Fusarium oxysporum Fo47]EWZ91588.1 hypothetical protein FOWG_07084 [Fusarium oxysporum f. sp. lycopersici MN25]EXA52847.1 hypothetical protein FOVG_00945 [Fusarium oxysporum f. sp. pisi HDV247]EXK48201.1 hypothetical protein FOMG_01254 [Fusarium oxysporum f. sp. melonis 26406]EXK88314.1 hypothetical protein FOQG_08619 [Fusarium oxysporum f. sp. raphani 54005]EXL49832.1 hy
MATETYALVISRASSPFETNGFNETGPATTLNGLLIAASAALLTNADVNPI